jgi:hypothetical protein
VTQTKQPPGKPGRFIQCCGDVIERLIEIAHKVVNCRALVPAIGKVGGDRDNPIESFEGGAMIAGAIPETG